MKQQEQLTHVSTSYDSSSSNNTYNISKAYMYNVHVCILTNPDGFVDYHRVMNEEQNFHRGN
jgi:hypothetical protein